MLKLYCDSRLSALLSFNQTFEKAVEMFGHVTTHVVITSEMFDNGIIYQRKHREVGLRSVQVIPCGDKEFRVSLIGDGMIHTVQFDHNKLLESEEWFDQFIQFLIDGSLQLLKGNN